ncbi:MAG: translocation/assembly module TamB domain-containing protein [Polyangiales bacterium]
MVRRALIVASVACLLLGAAVAMRAQQLRGKARAELTRVLGAAFGLKAHVREAELDLFGACLRARDVELDDATGTQVLRADELRVRSSLRGLLSGRVEPSSLLLSGVSVRIDLRSEGGVRSTAVSAMPRSVSLRDARIVAELPELGTLQLERVGLDIDASSGLGDAVLDLRAQTATLTRAGTVLARGALHVHGNSAEAAGQRSAAGRLQLERASLAGVELPSALALSWHTESSRIGVKGALDLGKSEGALGFDTVLDLHTRALKLDLWPRGLELRPLLARLGLSRVALDARLDGSAELRGTLFPLALRGPLALSAHGLRLGAGTDNSGTALLALAAPRLAADARLDATGVSLDSLRVEAGSSVLAGQLRSGWDGALDASVAGAAVSLEDFSPLAGISIAGHGKLDLRAHGPLAAPDLHATLALDGAALGGYALGRAVAELDALDEARELRFTRAEIDSTERRLSAQTLRLRFDGGLSELQARLRIARLPLADLYRALGAADDPLLARLDAVAAGDADLDFARQGGAGKLDLGLALSLSEASLDGFAFDRGRLDAKIALPDASRGLGAGTITLSRLGLVAGDGQLALDGKLERGALAMNIALEGLPLARPPFIRAHLPQLDGRAHGRGELRGSATGLRARAEVTLDALSLQGHALGHAHLLARLQGPHDGGDPQVAAGQPCNDGRAALDSGALVGVHENAASASAWLICGDGIGGRLHVDLGLGGGPERKLRGSLALDGFDLSPFLPEQAPGSRVPGKLSAVLAIEQGELEAPARWSFRLRVRELAFGQGELALASRAPFELRAQNGKLELHDATLDGPKAVLVLSATGSLEHEPRVLADGTAAASLFTRSSEPLVQAFGDVSIHAALSPGAEPFLRVVAEPREVLVRVAPGLAIRKLRGTLVLEGERVRAQQLEADVGGGVLTLGGELALRGIHVSSYDLTITAERVAIEPQPKLETVFDAETKLQWSGAAAPPVLTGSVRLKSLLYARHLQLPEALSAVNRQDRTNAAEYDPARDRLRFDLEVEHEKPLRVHNNVLDAELELAGEERKLHLKGSDQRFGVVGKLAVARGKVLFHGDEFQITRGEVGFVDERRVTPSFELRAIAERRAQTDTNIVLVARGGRDAFDLHVECEPAAGRADTPPFTCDYAHEELRCDSFEHLVKLWLCRGTTELSSADPAR